MFELMTDFLRRTKALDWELTIVHYKIQYVMTRVILLLHNQVVKFYGWNIYKKDMAQFLMCT